MAHAPSIQAACEDRDTVPRRHRAMRNEIFTSPVLLEYTKYMRGVDVADQLRASNICQTRSHKWWHWVFWFLVDTFIMNMYIMYLHIYGTATNPITSKTHLQFKTDLCSELLTNWKGCQERSNQNLENRPNIHMPSWTAICHAYVVCESIIHTYCFQCNGAFMCWQGGCYERYHTWQ